MDKNKKRRIWNSIRGQILLAGLIPLLIMSTAVSIMSIKGINGYALANVITVVLVFGVVLLLYITK